MQRYLKEELLTKIVGAMKGRSFKKREVRFLLSSDKEIEGERRVGLTPEQVGKLKSVLAECGLSLTAFVVKGAGELDEASPCFPDEHYEDAGAQVVGVDELDKLAGVDVVHALKEPTSLEARLPGPFLRVGALHLANRPEGVCRLLEKKNFAAMFDGATLGDCSYLITGDVRNPVVASMSRIAGDLAAKHLLDSRDLTKDKVIIFGAGIAGLRAIVALRDKINEITVVERLPEKEGDVNVRGYVNWLLLTLGFHKHRVLEKIQEAETHEIFKDAAGIIFAQRVGAKKAEKVCRLQDIKGIVKPDAGIVDIAIDQGGSIDYDGIAEEDNIKTRISKYRDALRGYRYKAETNMPRELPFECSTMHGYAMLPYCAALLLLCAEHGGPSEAGAYLLSKDETKFSSPDALPVNYKDDFFQCVAQDLRNGLELSVRDGQVSIEHSDIKKDEDLVNWIHQCAENSSPSAA